MTVHSGIFGPVHTGILSGIELFGLEPCSTTSATGPSRCVPPPCGTTAPPKSGDILLESLSLLRRSCPRHVSTASLGFPGSPFVLDYLVYASSASTTSGLSGGRWAATDGRAETAVIKGYSFFVEVLIVHWHFHGSHGARFLYSFKSVVTSSGKEGGKHSSGSRMVGTPEKRGLLPLSPTVLDRMLDPSSISVVVVVVLPAGSCCKNPRGEII